MTPTPSKSSIGSQEQFSSTYECGEHIAHKRLILQAVVMGIFLAGIKNTSIKRAVILKQNIYATHRDIYLGKYMQDLKSYSDCDGTRSF